ncbi:MAG: ATP-binding cassette domain-containing protein [Cryomorphaceae bacterium]|nr:ATP-binding cassette domain-containing protein [Cryomorphaceae bacterium]
MIQVTGIKKSFGDVEVLRGIDANFYEGKTNLIIGKSGSGKTVFLKCLLGLHNINAGEISFDGRPLSEMEDKQRRELRLELGMVFQGSALFDSLTVEENVSFPLKMFANMSKSEIEDRTNFCLKRVNIADANARFPAEISGGMQKRVAIARAIVMNPKYLFCDEPNSGLDPKTAMVIDELIKEITLEFNITTVINTHDMNSVMQIGDNIIFLADGKKAWEGNKEEVITTDDQEMADFVFSSELFKKIRRAARMEQGLR